MSVSVGRRARRLKCQVCARTKNMSHAGVLIVVRVGSSRVEGGADYALERMTRSVSEEGRELAMRSHRDFDIEIMRYVPWVSPRQTTRPRKKSTSRIASKSTHRLIPSLSLAPASKPPPSPPPSPSTHTHIQRRRYHEPGVIASCPFIPLLPFISSPTPRVHIAFSSINPKLTPSRLPHKK
ncbi:hypothetical protein K458DRAFT_32795 [Lentithecium fluviatile CBS 122367]|uniref:Uncharacterized protein n=1 Tax=Lentithecium fluviatile CBS 122367 TaxID=1168545 RepID=A0A6G1J1W2_9PLEO|nr:hypothetical protein K458DRAFT_32795 [Lentithecium fluviatile CBS 122367]